uniref:Signal peptidase complex subunit 2 n=1 Tax=Pyramimonas obovata TaxID=1411642 RepID=A0A7S0R521_9CHLO|mmetsp:Transcript_25711/g.55846  ORF Transcript_25711/g.55846 Transcript_25711/m.55846 type:complete len:192 (+) Transcript_25711:279-854(+)|eukprot:CAMPEP_0118933504 /NCGR_PEP_ID=MMETSP1169-20130426/12025_1 /TAXON_ID=36882 /ORGANISM="Pyramimonas obovata, Strain CCMP722" /LENGTH=191 /DNA_ID=CAMNT_0006876273 /DNA_START=258 /DNA_END=833 /DNA_ORIENTATION=+
MKPQDQIPRQAVNLGDTAQIKRVLDEAASEAIIDAGYPEEFNVSNKKIVLGLLTCSFALVAQFFPKNHPQTNTVQLLCVVGYFVLNTLLQVFMMIFERDVIIFTHPRKDASSSTGIAVSTQLPRFSDQYKIILASADPKASAARSPVVLERSIVDWFYEDGHLADDIFKKDVAALLKQFESADTLREVKDR